MVESATQPFYYHIRKHRSDKLFDYPLRIPKGMKVVTNELLFGLLFDFLFNDLPVLMTKSHYASAYNCLTFHYLSCTLPRFDFVRFTRENYEKSIESNGIPKGHEQTHSDILRWLYDHEQNSAIYEGTIRLFKKISKVDPEEPDIPLGTWKSWVPETRSDLEAFQRLRFLTSQQVCEFLIKDFNLRYPNADQRIYQAELDDINLFIADTNTIDIRKALINKDADDRHEYLRLTNGYYLNHRCDYAIGSTASVVYGRNYWYKDWLEKKVRHLHESPKLVALPDLTCKHNGSIAGISKEAFELIITRNNLSGFFKVKSKSLEGSFWYDVNDRPTSDPNMVVRVSKDSFQQKRKASTEDFPEIFETYNITGKTSGRILKYFLEDLVNYVQEMIVFHRTLHKPNEKELSHYELLELADDFIEWLKKMPVSVSKIGSGPNNGSKKTLIRRLAMYHFYIDEPITRENGDYFAKQYGHTSGEKFYSWYCYILKPQNRTGPTSNPEQDVKRLADYDHVIELLADHPEAKRKAITDKEGFSKVATC